MVSPASSGVDRGNTLGILAALMVTYRPIRLCESVHTSAILRKYDKASFMVGIMALTSNFAFLGGILRSSSRIFAVGAFAAAAASSASAESTCVLCNGPEAAYECNAYANDPIPDTALALFCTTRIADDYGHKSCAVEKTTSSCTGLPVHFPYNPNDGGSFGFSFEPQQEDANGEPETLGELASDTYNASKETVKATGEAIGNATEKAGNALNDAGASINNATKNTVKCIQSALADC
jgi:hypothetical protein